MNHRHVPRPYKSGRDALTPDEVRRLLDACTSLEEQALLGVAIATGMRREDVVALQRTGVTTLGPNEVRIKFWEQKKRRDWTVTVAGDVAHDLLLWMGGRPGSRWVFPGHFGRGDGHLASRSAYNMLQRVLGRAGLRGRPFHALRATCMKLCRIRGWTVEQTMELTGDSWRTVQEHYLTPSEDEMRLVARDRPVIDRRA